MDFFVIISSGCPRLKRCFSFLSPANEMRESSLSIDLQGSDKERSFEKMRLKF